MKKTLVLVAAAALGANLFGQESPAGAQPPVKKAFPKIKIDTSAAHLARLREIDRDIWRPFADAYAAGDAEKYCSLNAPGFIRAGNDRIGDLQSTLENSRFHFQKNRDAGNRCEIAFSFFERVAGESAASERGTYRYSFFPKDDPRQDFYGRFHVFHQKLDGRWRIAVDYDSDEDGTIGREDFEAGVPPGG